MRHFSLKRRLLSWIFLSFSFSVLSFHFSLASDSLATALNQYQSGLAYERLGRYDEAYTQLQLAANLEPNNPQMALALGIVAIRLGSYDEALRSLEHTVALDAGSAASYYELALLYEKKALPDRALESWHRFVQLNQDEPLKAIAKKHIEYLEALH